MFKKLFILTLLAVPCVAGLNAVCLSCKNGVCKKPLYTKRCTKCKAEFKTRNKRVTICSACTTVANVVKKTK